MNLKLLTSADDIFLQAERWNAVAGLNPFFSHAWMANWIRFMAGRFDIRVLVGVDDDGQWVGIAPCCIETRRGFGRTLRLLGSGRTCTDYHNFIAQPRYYRDFVDQATRWLADNNRSGTELGHIDSIELEGISAECDRAAYLRQQMEAQGFMLYQTPVESCWVVDLPRTWHELNSRFSKSLRRKTQKAVGRISHSDFAFLSTDQLALEDLWPPFVDLHQKRRQSLGQPGCFADSSYGRFLKSSVESLVAYRQAELVLLTYQNQPLASMLLLNDGQTVFMYQSGMAPELSHLEPGYILITTALQRSIEKGFSHFDFLRGDEPYKARWNTRAHRLTKDKFITRALSSRLKHQIWLAGKAITKGLIWGDLSPALASQAAATHSSAD